MSQMKEFDMDVRNAKSYIEYFNAFYRTLSTRRLWRGGNSIMDVYFWS